MKDFELSEPFIAYGSTDDNNIIGLIALVRQGVAFTAFENLSEDDLAAMGKLFTSINKNPKEGSKETEVRNIVFKLLP